MEDSILVYFSVFAIVFALNAFSGIIKNKIMRTILPISSFIILLCFIGFRQNVGTDYNTYVNNYLSIKDTPWQDLFTIRIEPLVCVIYKIFCNIFEDYHWIFFMYGLLSLAPIYIANKLYNNKYLAFSVLMYCVFFMPFSLNGMRQGVALSFVFLSFVLSVKEKKKLSLLSMLVAFAFHNTAVIAMPFLIASIINKKHKKKEPLIYLAISISIAISIITILKDAILETEFGGYAVYLTKVSYDNISFASIISYLPILCMTYAIHKKMIRLPETVERYNLLFCVGMLFQVVGTIAAYVNRIALYFLPGLLLPVPMLLDSIKKPIPRLVVKIGIIVYLIAYFIVQFVVWERHNIIPYQTWI